MGENELLGGGLRLLSAFIVVTGIVVMFICVTLERKAVSFFN